jgi:hypothetical protein
VYRQTTTIAHLTLWLRWGKHLFSHPISSQKLAKKRRKIFTAQFRKFLIGWNRSPPWSANIRKLAKDHKGYLKGIFRKCLPHLSQRVRWPAHYHNKCVDINWSSLLRSAILSLWYSRFEVMWLLRDHFNGKTCVRFVTC